ncbi:hypothetical protein GCM10027059_07030 [Myceligenerans halotolerans]
MAKRYSVKCPDCRQRVGIVRSKIAMHQKGGPGTGKCPGSNKNESAGSDRAEHDG